MSPVARAHSRSTLYSTNVLHHLTIHRTPSQTHDDDDDDDVDNDHDAANARDCASATPTLPFTDARVARLSQFTSTSHERHSQTTPHPQRPRISLLPRPPSGHHTIPAKWHFPRFYSGSMNICDVRDLHASSIYAPHRLAFYTRSKNFSTVCTKNGRYALGVIGVVKTI